MRLGRRAVQLRSTEQAKRWLVEKYAKKYPDVVSLTLFLMRSRGGWSHRELAASSTQRGQLDDPAEIPWQSLPLVPWLANRLRKGGEKNPPIALFYSVLTEVPDLTDAERVKLERLWRPYEESMDWVVPEEGRVAAGPTAARKLELSFIPRTARVLGWERVNKITARASITGLNRNSLSDIGDWARSQNPDMGRTTIRQALEGSEDWHESLVQDEKPRLRSRDQGQVVIRLRKGWTWQKLHEQDLPAEGDAMGHCIGGEDYVERAEAGDSTFYSLRDSKGQPHVTVEVSAINTEVLDGLHAAWDWSFETDDGVTFFHLDPNDKKDLAAIKELEGFQHLVGEIGEDEALEWLGSFYTEGDTVDWSSGRFIPPGDASGLWQDKFVMLSGRENAQPHKKYSSAIVSLVEKLTKGFGGLGGLKDPGAAAQYLTQKDMRRIFGPSFRLAPSGPRR